MAGARGRAGGAPQAMQTRGGRARVRCDREPPEGDDVSAPAQPSDREQGREVRSGRRLTPKGTATRERIIELATEVFASDGYAAASVRDIAARSGLSIGAIYGTFRGKADLLVEALERHIARYIEDLPAGVTDQPLPDIDAWQFAHHADRERLRVLLMDAAVAARSDDETRARVHDLLEAQIGVAVEAHEEWGERAGVDGAVDMQALVMLLWSADLGLAVLGALGFDPPDPDAWAELTRRLLLSLQAPDAKPGPPTERTLPSERRRDR
jgi:AcrR family transcriptional regulator